MITLIAHSIDNMKVRNLMTYKSTADDEIISIDIANLTMDIDDFTNCLEKCSFEYKDVVKGLMQLGDKDSLTLAYEISKL